MSRRPLALALFIAAGLTAWAAARPGGAAHAGPCAPTPGRETVAADYSVNDEEAAAHRWATGQARHWRQLMIKR
jgi:hypothetical protein